MPLSPSFPDWLLKRDPTLAGALTNPLFLAFEGRRLRRPGDDAGSELRRFLIPILKVIAFVGTIFLVNHAFMSGIAIPSWAMFGLPFLLLPVLILPLALRSWRRTRRGPRIADFPLGLCDAIKPGIADSVAIDLAVLPFPTAVTLTASVLERRRLDVSKSVLFSVTAIGMLCFFIAHSIVAAGRQFSTVDFAIFGALALEIPHLGMMLYWALARYNLIQSWEALDAVSPPGVQIDSRPTFETPGGWLIPSLFFAPIYPTMFLPMLLDLFGRASETERFVFFLVVAFSTLGCHLLARHWRRGFIDNLESMERIQPENLADILLDTQSMITRKPD
jgi:hypothetical protein